MQKLICLLLLSLQLSAQHTPDIQVLGTRSWVRVSWLHPGKKAYKLYFSETAVKPARSVSHIPENETSYYFTHVKPETRYYIWVEEEGVGVVFRSAVTTSKKWQLVPWEGKNLSILSSAAVPAGMHLFWQDEFNDHQLNRNKWSTNYYSTIDFRDSTNLAAMRNNTLPQPGFILNGKSITLITNDAMPAGFFFPGRKVSSIQTYDWGKNENLLDNSRGGYFEARVKRSNYPEKLAGVNVAFWMDAPGPDLRYYMEKGNTAYHVTGIRPPGQTFEIDIFEQDGEHPHATPFTMHGKVDAKGTFKGNLTTYNASGNFQDEWVVHGLLWTPVSIRYYIDGVLRKEWSDPAHSMSPNHFMNMFLGVYGKWKYGEGKSASMEVDYIRGYQWPELPNPGFEYDTLSYPWMGDAVISTSAKRNGEQGALLAPGQSLVQYIYLDNDKACRLLYWAKGAGVLEAKVENVMQVSGKVENTYSAKADVTSTFRQFQLRFKTAPEYKDHKRTVKISFRNTGTVAIALDDISLQHE